jgi:uncharacterized OB-fold protein
MGAPKPIPEADPDSAPFWASCREGRLLLQRCADCRAFRYPPASRCAACGSTENEWVEASGRGRVFSWIVVRHPVPKDVYADEVPYVVALVALEEGPRMATNIVGCPPEAVQADMPVTVAFRERDGVTLPVFQPL